MSPAVAKCPKMPAIVQPLVTAVARPTVMEEAMGERDGSGLGYGQVSAGRASAPAD